ncbi:unnamed protein product, partial [Rotaria magnacalcarata]
MFQIDLVDSEHQERCTEEIIHSRTDYLDRAENIQLMDRIDVIVSDALNFSNEQERPQALEVPDDETKRSTREQALFSLNSSPVSKRLLRELEQQRLLNTCESKAPMFIVESSLFAKDSGSLEPILIIGRLLPRSDIFNQATYRVEILIPTGYLFVASE